MPATPMQCRACGGAYQLGGLTCRWCTEGWMDGEQFNRWMRFKSGPRLAGGDPKSTRRFDPHRVVILERLERAWAKEAKMRLGELIVEALAFQNIAPETLSSLDDKRLAEIVEHYILMRGT